MKYIQQIIFIILAGAALFSCEESYLDRPVTDEVVKEDVFTDYREVYDFVNHIYALRDRGIDHEILTAATDESLESDLGSTIHYLNNGNWSPSFNPVDRWGTGFRAIRLANIFFDNVDLMELTNYDQPITDPNEQNANGELITAAELKSRFMGEVYFLRGYYQLELFKRYGALPVLKSVLDENDANINRSSVQETVDAIVSDFDNAMALLPDNYNYYPAHKGRATAPMAQAFKSQALLFAASPLFNPENNQERWMDAMTSSRAVIDGGHYQLGSNYKGVFVNNRDNPEIIWSIRKRATNSVERSNTPVGYEGGGGGLNPLEELVSDYEMSDGTPFDWDNPEHAAQPYANRDPRFYASILYNGADWQGRKVQTYVGGLDGEGVNNATLTGYYYAKRMDPQLDLLRNQTSIKNWVVLRYGEILLNYAEARNEAIGPDEMVYQTVNQIRERAGMPGLEEGLTQDEMRNKIRHERRIELAFEGNRFFDVRRWEIGTRTFDGPVHGVRPVIQSDSTYQYNVIEVENRIFTEKMKLFPIQEQEIINTNGSLTQNPGW